MQPLIANKLSLNVAKTEFMLIGSKPIIKSIANQQPNIAIENKTIKQVWDSKSLGVTLDQHLSWKKNTDNICKKIASGISALRRAKDYVHKDTLLSIYNALIHPYFTYCCEVWDVFSETQSKRLQKLQNRAARIIANMSNIVDHEIALRSLEWKPLDIERQKSKAKLMFKLLNNMGPKSLPYLVSRANQLITNFVVLKKTLCLPQPRSNSMKKSLAFNGPQVWNSLPNELKEISSLATFQRKIASHFPKTNYVLN
ncbi:uncharacterized protein LOC124444556 [Xenia sp. Carnegie-2017]|uniref:uncharacterized protein LOC124444556 n=1 Tax=Xenia sp. Carnegie-2017 TaxID=2897299 RepID=UPI001F043659|nr:uncharacterized protein LOC124444556 [Xenia sp. Carnegie-2017]